MPTYVQQGAALNPAKILSDVGLDHIVQSPQFSPIHSEVANMLMTVLLLLETKSPVAIPTS